MTLHDLLKVTGALGGSDLHLSVGSPPQVRVDGALRPLDLPVLTTDLAKGLAYGPLTDAQRERFESTWELDLAFAVPDVGRVRANLFRQRGAVGGVYRMIPAEVPPLDALGLPGTLGDLALRPRGLVLVTGPTGSGKSTTLAAMVDRINRSRAAHILTIEDPIEYIHAHKRSLVNQRELHGDTQSISGALRAALREDPDVILIGELRDLETIQAALTLAETGHLTMGTLHTSSAVQTISRVVDAFPAHQQAQVRMQLSLVLEGVVSQLLLPRSNGRGRVPATEILVATPAVRALIRDDKLHQLYGTMQTAQHKSGMQTMNQALARLVEEGVLTRALAVASSSHSEELATMLERQRGTGR